jgi:hypothetical protein
MGKKIVFPECGRPQKDEYDETVEAVEIHKRK